jgi:hypothetical protein
MRARTNLATIRREVDEILATVTIPDPFDITEFCALLSAQRDRPIRLITTGESPVSGAWLAMPGADYVVYSDQTSAIHRENIILHEIGHILFQHENPEAGPDLALFAGLMPNLSPDLIRRALGRGGYSSIAECQAEMFASRVWQRAGRSRDLVRSGPRPSAADAMVLNRITDVMADPV